MLLQIKWQKIELKERCNYTLLENVKVEFRVVVC